MKSNVILDLLDGGSPNFLLILAFIHIVNLILSGVVERRNDGKTKKNKKTKPKVPLISRLIIPSILLVLFFSVDFFKTVFMVVDTLFLMYALIICPLFNIKLPYSFKDDSTMIVSFLSTEILYVNFCINYDSLASIISSEIILQVVVIVIIAMKLLLLSYFVVLSIYNIVKNLNILIVDNLNKKIDTSIKKFYEKYDLGYLEKLLIDKRCFPVKSFIFIYKTIIWTLMVIIVGFVFPIHIVYNFVSKIFKNDSNNIFYVLSKLSLIASLLSTYCIIIFTDEFNASIVSIFELIISTLIIPTILEMLLSKKKNDKKLS